MRMARAPVSAVSGDELKLASVSKLCAQAEGEWRQQCRGGEQCREGRGGEEGSSDAGESQGWTLES